MKSFSIVVAALSLGSTAYATPLQQCLQGTEICYSLSIPDSTANSGSGDIFFQISAPTSYQWVALGQGSQMAGANIFVMYTSSNGNNVTLSPRLGKGHVEPDYNSAARTMVLEGSGVQNGKMTANVQCSNCGSWTGGSMDFSSSQASWIYAYKSGSELNSNSLSQGISQHDSEGSFNWDLSAAKGGNDANPFIAAGGSTGTASGASTPTATTSYTVSGTVIPGTCTPIGASATTSASGASATVTNGGSGDGCPTGRPTGRPTWPASCFSGYPSRPTNGPPKIKRDDGCPAGYESTANSISPDIVSSNESTATNLVLAHGVIACIAFVALFPIGGILIRVASFPGLLWVHAALQGFGFLFYIVAFGMGVYMATSLNYMSKAHPIIGIALLMVLILQPVFGFMHHKMFQKYNRRTLWSYAHIWHGRVAILLGIVNGGLGIQLAGDASSSQKIAYAVVAAIMSLAYIGAAIFGEIRRRRKQPPNFEKSQRGQRRQSHQLRDLSSSEENVQHQGYYAKQEGQRI